MKKMTYIIIFGILVIIVIFVGFFVYKNGKVERECRKQANIVRIKTNLPDGAKNAFYECLKEKGLDPNKYKWEGKNLNEYVSQKTNSENSDNISGVYVNSNDTTCQLKLTLQKNKDDKTYNFNLSTGKRKYAGPIYIVKDNIAIAGGVNIILGQTDVRAVSLARFDDNGEPFFVNRLPENLSFLWEDNVMTIQNSTNSTNQSNIFKECNEKLITLRKQEI